MPIIKLVAASWRVSDCSLLIVQEAIGWWQQKIEQKIQDCHGLSCNVNFFPNL
jgi:hypothetical protein